MRLFARLVRATFAFGRIMIVYLVYRGLRRVFARSTGSGVKDPAWLSRWRERVDKRSAKRLYKTIVRLRGVYIKLGQVLSMMGGFLPHVITKELESLQDAVPPLQASKIRAAIESRLGAPVDALFGSFEDEPLAAASLGQVHRATLSDGRQVAVKVLYPGIDGIIRVDMKVIGWAMKVYRWFVPVQNIESVHEALNSLLERETNYELEAESMLTMAENFSSIPSVVFPEPIQDRSTRDVLTMTLMEGEKITDVDAAERAGIDMKAVARTLVEAFYKQLFVDRFFHADPHPGNFLLRKNESGADEIVILDFGAASVAKAELVDGLVSALRGFLEKRDDLVLEGIETIGFVAVDGDRALLEDTVKRYFAKLLQVEDISPRALMDASPEALEELADPELARRELRALMKSIRYPDGWFYVERACVLMFWLCAQLDPDLDTLRVGLPYVLPLLAKRAAG